MLPSLPITVFLSLKIPTQSRQISNGGRPDLEYGPVNLTCMQISMRQNQSSTARTGHADASEAPMPNYAKPMCRAPPQLKKGPGRKSTTVRRTNRTRRCPTLSTLPEQRQPGGKIALRGGGSPARSASRTCREYPARLMWQYRQYIRGRTEVKSRSDRAGRSAQPSCLRAPQ